MQRLIPILACLLLVPYFIKGDNESDFIGGVSESDIDTWYDIHYSAMIETIYDSIPSLNTSSIHILGLELKDHFDQVQSLDIQSSLAAGKILYLAEELKKNEDLKQDPGALEVVNNIIEKSSLFARNLARSYACHAVEGIKYVTAGDLKDKNEDNKEYIVFYNPGEPEISKVKIIANPEGDKLMFTIERSQKGNSIVFKYSILIDNADYPEDVRLYADNTMKKRISIEEITDAEICAMDPKPRARICIPMTKFYSMTFQDADKISETRSQIIEHHIKMCK